MKRLLFVLLMALPFIGMAQQKPADTSDFKGWTIGDCQKFVLGELAKGDKGKLKEATAGRITPNTKTIYIAKQTWLQNMPETLNGYTLKYVDLDDELANIAADIKKNNAAVYYISPFEVKTNMCEMWIFPVDVKKKSKDFNATAFKMNFFFNYDPPVYEYRGTEKVVL